MFLLQVLHIRVPGSISQPGANLITKNTGRELNKNGTSRVDPPKEGWPEDKEKGDSSGRRRRASPLLHTALQSKSPLMIPHFARTCSNCSVSKSSSPPISSKPTMVCSVFP